MMTMKRFVFFFVAAGALLPAVWLGLYRVYPVVIESLMSAAWMGGLLLVLWPSSILMLGDPRDTSVILPVLSLSLNVVLYGILGVLFWIGLKRVRTVLIVTVALLLLGWYGLLKFYY